MSESVNNSGIRIDRVRIHNFRSLCDVRVTLGDMCLLIGMNNSGKTSFLRALHLALGTDRRLIQSEDFHINPNGEQAKKITIDVRIVPIDDQGKRTNEFAAQWTETDFPDDWIASDDQGGELIALRTEIERDPLTSEFTLTRSRLPNWDESEEWWKLKAKKNNRRFQQLASFLIDAQRDMVADLHSRSSYFGRLLSNLQFDDEAVKSLEKQLNELNESIVEESEVLRHLRKTLRDLADTVSAMGEGVSLSPVSAKLRELNKGMGIQFADQGGSELPLEFHGMGTRSWASLLSFKAYVSWMQQLSEDGNKPFHPVLFLEEPEAHLHPHAQRTVYRQLTKEVGQRIVSTHSPFIAGQAALDEFLHFAKNRTYTKVHRLDLQDWSTDDRRKVQREITRSRGELLFARAVILFEGETEQVALPEFARHHWGVDPFDKGVSFVGVGGDGNYGPFLRIFEGLMIPWFIFSDGEKDARDKVSKTLKKLGVRETSTRVFTIPKDQAIEGYLIECGYQAELKQAYVNHACENVDSPQYREAKKKKCDSWNDDQLLEKLKSAKTSLVHHWTNTIQNCGSEKRQIPPLIRDLLRAVDAHLELTQTKSKS